MLAQDFKLFFVGALFFPGSYYDDIKGLAITKDQQKYLEGKGDFALLPNNHVAFFMNVGLEYRF